MSWTFTVTLHLWWLWAYLAVGALLWFPLLWRAHRRTNRRASRRHSLWWNMRRAARQEPWALFVRSVVLLVAWPVAVWEDLR